MKTSAVIIILLAFACASARTAPAKTATVDPHVVVAGFAADLESYWRSTLGARLPKYEGPRSIVYYSSRIETPCGPSMIENAAYCSNDDTIYLDESWFDSLFAAGDDAPIAILAHEWGHEVQNELDTLNRSSERAYLRALELQADCFAGLFVRSERDGGRIDVSTVGAARRFFASAGDPSARTRSHGTGPQRLGWFDAGYESADFDVCAAVFRKERALPRIPDD